MSLEPQQNVHISILVRKKVLMLGLCLLNLTLYYRYYTNILHHFSLLKSYQFTYFSISAWEESGGTCDAKAKEKHQKKTKESHIYQ